MLRSILSILLMAMFHCAADCQQIQWQKCLGGTDDDRANSIQQTSDGGFIIAGWTSSNDGDVFGNHGDWDFWIVKLNSSSDTLWTKCYGGTGEDIAVSIIQTSDGSYIVAGITNSNDGDVSGNHGGYDFWVVKLAGNGNILWTKCLGGTGHDWGESIQQTSDGGYVVAGSSQSNSGDFRVFKLDSIGNVNWTKLLGGSDIEFGKSIKQTLDGGYIVTGSSRSNDGDVSGNHGLDDMWVVKLDSFGDTLWTKSLGGTGYDYGTSIQQSSDGSYIVAGITLSDDGDVSGQNGIVGSSDFWIVKLDSVGDTLGTKCLGGTLNDEAHDVRHTSDGGYILAGWTFSNNGDVSGNHGSDDIWVVKLNSSGDTLWTKCLGGSAKDRTYSIKQTSDGGYIVAGTTLSNDGDVSGNHGNDDFWVVKLSDPITSGIASHYSSSNVQVFPNPAEESVTFRIIKVPSDCKLQLYSYSGQLVITMEYHTSQFTVPRKGLPSGLYFYRIKSGGELYTGKVVFE